MARQFAEMEATKRDEKRYQAQLEYLQQRIAQNMSHRERLQKRIDELRAGRQP